jgi:DNA-binding SARP family transcriptional activator
VDPNDAQMTPAGDSMDCAADPDNTVAVDSMIAPIIRVRVVGAAEITLGRTKVRPDSAVLFALLLYLTARAGERIARADILELFWPGQPDPARRHSLRQIMYRIRRAGLECDAEGTELSIDAERVESDINRIRTAAWVAESPFEELPARGSVLSGVSGTLSPAFGEWLESLRGEANACVRRATMRHIAKARREGRWSDVGSAARLCLSSDPLNEEATLALAESTAMSGSKAEALRILDAYMWEIGDKAKEIGLPAKLLRRRISDQPQSRVPRLGETALVGRSEEIAWLNDRLEGMQAGGSNAVMLVGPPGIGKSAIAKAFGAQVEMRGWRMLEARLQPSDVMRPMSLFVELLPALLKAEGAIGASPESIQLINQLLKHDESDEAMAERVREGPAFPARLGAAILDLVTAVSDEGPLVLLLDDLHWTDPHSLRALARLSESTADKSVFFVLGTRTEGQFGSVREALSPERVSLRIVPPLSAAAITELLTALAPEATRESTAETLNSALTLTGGNPLFVRGLAAHWNASGITEGLPADLRQLMRSRVAKLSPQSLRVLHSCAMLGRYATVARLTRMLESGTSELLACIEELDELGVLGLIDEPGSLALHDLWAEELLAGLRAPTRALLHLRCGEVLEGEADESRTSAIVLDAARHLIAAGAPERAAGFLEGAIRSQLANGFTDVAVSTACQAFEAAAGVTNQSRLKALYLEALRASGDWSRILEVCGPLADSIVSGMNREESRTYEESLVIEAIWRTGTAPSAGVRAALECAEDATSGREHRAAACLLAAQAAANLFDLPALARVRDALDSLHVDSDSESSTMLAAQVILESEVGSLARAVETSTRLIELERRRKSVLGLSLALRFSSYPVRIVGQWQRGFDACVEAYELSSRHQLTEEAGKAADMAATCLFEVNRFKDSVRWVERAELWASKARLPYLLRSVYFDRVFLALRSGELALADQMLASVSFLETPSATRDTLELLALRAELHAARGEFDQLAQNVQGLQRRLEPDMQWNRLDRYAVALVHGLRALNRQAEADAFLQSFLRSRRAGYAPAGPTFD